MSLLGHGDFAAEYRRVAAPLDKLRMKGAEDRSAPFITNSEARPFISARSRRPLITLSITTSARRRCTDADALRRIRQDAGLTQRDAARQLGSSQAALARLENGDLNTTLYTLMRL
jgi:DNA-binding XRE family transcriptional regulator